MRGNIVSRIKPSTLLTVAELAIVLTFCFVPLLFINPYRINIFLSWEGAYRLYLGQMPFRDFSLPMGYGYWVIPAVFFKIFGPYMYSLIKAQVFINLMSVLAFRGILKTFDVSQRVIFLSVVVFCFSYVSFNFWPWYNHSVVVFEIIGIYFLLRGLLKAEGLKAYLLVVASAFFIFWSIFTKQDSGAFACLIAGGLASYHAIVTRSWKKLAAFAGSFLLISAIIILPLLKYDFIYWFNYGQEPHESRINIWNFMNQILGWAYWEKFFLLLTALILMEQMRTSVSFLRNQSQVMFGWITIAILVQAMVIQVTSPVPTKNEVFFYAFAFAFCMHHLPVSRSLHRWPYFATALLLVVFWWTGIYWRNVQRLLVAKPPIVKKQEAEAGTRYRVAREFKTMERLFLAEETIAGIHQIKNLPAFKTKTPPVVLNMSELTPLAHELGFTPPLNQPMWYHQTVSIFDKEVAEFCEKIKSNSYDVVIFERVSEKEVVNFYPSEVLKCLHENYQYEFSFLAPRTPEESYIDVFTKR